MLANYVFGWLVVGAVAGWLATAVMRTRLQHGLLIDVLLGFLGASVGGGVFTALATRALPGFSTFRTVGLVPVIPGFNGWNIPIAFLAALVLLGMLRLLSRSRATQHLHRVTSLSGRLVEP